MNNYESHLEGQYWDIRRVSQYLGIKMSTVYALVEEKRIPHYRIKRLIRFKREEIDIWMEGNRQETLDLAGKKLIAAPQRRQRLDVDHIVKKAVAQVKRKKYISSARRPDQVKGLGKEVDYGSL